MLESRFKLREHGATIGSELVGGITTFLTMAYILVVNPNILAAAKMPREALFTATALGAIIGTLLVAFIANMPFALAPGMGINAFFAYVLVIGKGYTWQEALTAVLFSGIAFLLLTVFRVREKLLNSIPEGIKRAVGVSLGMMIASIGMFNAGLIVKGEPFVVLGDITTGPPLLALIGVAVTGILLALRVKGALLLGIIITTLIGIPLHVTNLSTLQQTGVVSIPPSVAPISFAFSFEPARILTLDFLVVCFTFLFTDIFDSLGTFMGVLERLGARQEQYRPRVGLALLGDAIATIIGACFGTSTVTTYVESSSGITAGARTGLSSVFTAVLFIIALFAAPLFLVVPAAATAPVMIIVGLFLLETVGKIDFGDITDSLPAIVSILVMTFTWNIANGLAFAWIAYVLLKLFTGRVRELNLFVVILGAIFVVKLFFLK